MIRQSLFSILALSLLALASPAPQETHFDLLVRGGRVLDGSGNPWFSADIGIRGDRIVALGDLSGATAEQTLDASGLYVAPGFIDVHSHAAGGLSTPELSGGVPLLAQGTTTIVGNPDGGGPTDFEAQRGDLEQDGLGVNVALLAPHGSIRREVLGMQNRAPTAAELEAMKALVRQGMEAGAYGLSSGLYYAPGSYAKTQEVIELARVAGEYGGVYTSHIRDEADYTIGVVAAVDEVIEIAQEAHLPGIVSHIKALGPRVWGFGAALVKRIQRARDAGIEVYADQYPYEASGTGITGALVPRWAQVGGREKLVERIEDPVERKRLKADMLENLDRRGGPSRLQFRSFRPDPNIEGKTLEEVSRARGMTPIDLCLELLKQGGAGFVSFNMDEGDIEILMRQPWTMTSSDGDLVPMGEGVPHPRSYATYSHKLRKYVVDEQVITLEEAVRSMTSLPARVFDLNDRGLLAAGKIADLVVFDLSKVKDVATYQDPHHLSEGMRHVVVAGIPAIRDWHITGLLAGRVLRHRGGPSYPKPERN